MGIWNPESGIRNAEFAIIQILTCQSIPFLFFENHFAFTIIISSFTLQDIEQNVLEALADQGIKKPLIELFAAIQT